MGMVTRQDAELSTQRLDHLGLVAGMYDELGIGEVLDGAIVQDRRQRGVTVGQAVKAMVVNGLGFTNRALYLMPRFFQGKPVERLIGPGVRAEHLNDDTLGRALDQLFEHDVTGLFSLLAAQAVQRLGLQSRTAHLDATAFHVDGRINSDQEPETGVVQICQGYSRDHRPDLNQVALDLIVENQAGLPLWLAPMSGNTNDTAGFGQVIEEHVGQLQRDYQLDYWVADSALYSADNLQRLEQAHVRWITRVPERLTLAGEQLDCRAGQGEILTPGYRGQSVEVEYGGVSQRWLVVTSLAALERGRAGVDRRLERQMRADLKTFQALQGRTFGCRADAQQALEEATFTVIHLADAQVVEQRRHTSPGRPPAGAVPEVVGYRIEAAPYLDPNERFERLVRASAFILATNDRDTERLSDKEFLTLYKEQQHVERGFRFLKDPLFHAATVFLQSPKRVMALLMIMTLCLLVYAALEHRLRIALKQAGQTLPDQKDRLTDRPTMRWVFQLFEGIDRLQLPDRPSLILNLKAHHRRVIRLLGPPYEAIYS